MAAMRRVTMLFPEELWNDLAMAAPIRGQSRGAYARAVLEREVNRTLVMAGLKEETDPEALAHIARQKAERDAAVAEEGGK